MSGITWREVKSIQKSHRYFHNYLRKTAQNTIAYNYYIIPNNLTYDENQVEEAKVKKEEIDLKLAETAFDNFLQENDRSSMEAQKK